MKFYSEINRREHVEQPPLTIQRHRYRGVRESQKINLEIDQLTLAMKRLYARMTTREEGISEYVTDLIDGGEVTGVGEDGDATLDLAGLKALIARAQGLQQRVNDLERHHNG